MTKNLKSLQLFYVLMLALSFVVMGLSFLDVLPTDYVGNEPKLLYWINLYSIVTGLGGMYVCLRWFNFKCVVRAVKQEGENVAFRAFCSWVKLRLLVLSLVLLSNAVLYQASSYTETPKYCLLITYVACVFCWPSLSAFEHIRENYRQQGAE